jgi:hypothetical protein
MIRTTDPHGVENSTTQRDVTRRVVPAREELVLPPPPGPTCVRRKTTIGDTSLELAAVHAAGDDRLDHRAVAERPARVEVKNDAR